MNWSHAQGTSAASSGAVASISATFPSPVAAGDLVIAAVVIGNSGTISTVSDNYSNIYSLAASWTRENRLVALYGSAVTTGGPGLEVTVTPSTAQYTTLIIDDFTPTGAPASLAGGAGNGGNPSQPSAGPIGFAGTGLSYGAVGLPEAAGTPTPGAGYTLGTWFDFSAGNHFGLTTFYKANDTSGSASPSCTYSYGNTDWQEAAAVWTLRLAVPYHLLFGGANAGPMDTP